MNARPNQLPPPGNWRVWLIQAGRGFGKTRIGAEWTRESARHFPLVNIIGATADDARDIMIEGESGILACCPPHERPEYLPSKRRLEWPNGARTLIFTADEPERLRGKQHMRLWMDEVAAWRHPDAYDQAMLGLRLGSNPQAVATTTPRPTKLIRDLIADPSTVVTRGSTYENRANLAPQFLDQIVKRYEGTRLGRQELGGELLLDVQGALWVLAMFDERRAAPDLKRVVVAIDPAASSNEDSDETGIIVAGQGIDDDWYVLADRSGIFTPNEWAKRAIHAYDEFRADRIVAEVNNGGEMVASTLRTIRKDIPFKPVHASRGKAIRAEPIASLYTDRHVWHTQPFDTLEDQLCVAADTLITTARGDIPVQDVRAGDYALTRDGYKRVTWAGKTNDEASVSELLTSNVGRLVATTGHPVYTPDNGFIPLGLLKSGDALWVNTAPRLNGAASGGMLIGRAIYAIAEDNSCILPSGLLPMALSRTVSNSITETEISSITISPTWNASHVQNICDAIRAQSRRGTLKRGASSGTKRGNTANPEPSSVPSAASSLRVSECGQGSARSGAASATVISVTPLRQRIPVYNLAIAEKPEYYANGILVHNCNWTPDSGKSPDRLDALVWCLTELSEGKREVTFFRG